MVTKKTSAKGKGKGKAKVLNLKKETVKNLTNKESKRVKGGTTACLVGSIVGGNILSYRNSAVAQSLGGGSFGTSGIR